MNPVIIPVIDLLDGHVVHARGGRRGEYEPVCSALCDSSEPETVLRAFMAIHPFAIVYVADLGAILGRGRHAVVLNRLRHAHPGIQFWVDSGTPAPDTDTPGIRTVIGTESGVSASDLLDLKRAGHNHVLSLDFLAHGFAGDSAVPVTPECWPQDIIVMHLPSVGADLGPSWTTASSLMGQAPDHNWYLAGGVRDAEDLDAAGSRGFHGVLVATALHNGALGREHFPRAKKTPA